MWEKLVHTSRQHTTHFPPKMAEMSLPETRQVHQALTSHVQATNTTLSLQSFRWQGWAAAPHRWHYSLLRWHQPRLELHHLHPSSPQFTIHNQNNQLQQWTADQRAQSKGSHRLRPHYFSHSFSFSEDIIQQPCPAIFVQLNFYSKCNIIGGNSYSHFKFYY